MKNIYKYNILYILCFIIGLIEYLFTINKKLEKDKYKKIKCIENEIKSLDNSIINIKSRNDFISYKKDLNEKYDILNSIKKNKQNILIKIKTNKNLDVLYNINKKLEKLKNNWDEKIISNIDDILSEVNNEFRKTNPYIEQMEVINEKIEIIKKDLVSFEIKNASFTSKEELVSMHDSIRSKIDDLKNEHKLIINSEDINKIRNDFDILRIDTNKFIDGNILLEFEMIYKYEEKLINERIKDEKRLKQIVNEALKEEKQKKEEEKKKKEEERLIIFRNRNKDDLFLIEDYIKNEISKVNKEIKKINKLASKNRKKSSLLLFRKVFKTTLRFGVTLIPLSLFKNKLLGNLLSMVVLNNKIRSMRNIVKKQDVNYIDVEYLIDNIKKNKDIIDKNMSICDDSLYQLISLKEEFVNEYKEYMNLDEVKKTMDSIEILENTLVKQKEKLTKNKNTLNNKVKQLSK